MKKLKVGQIEFDPTTQPGYRSRYGFTFDRYQGDLVNEAPEPHRGDHVNPMLPEGLKSFQLPEVLPSRRRMKRVR